MPRPRRPSAALVVALIALFVALGGPAQARRLVTGKDVRDHSLTTRDLSKRTVRRLRATPARSVGTKAIRTAAVTGAKLAPGAAGVGKIGPGAVGGDQLTQGAVGARELRPASVGSLQLADGAVTGAKVADGSLDARDVARYSGRFRIAVPAVPANTCWSGEPVGLAPEQAGADISSDLVVVTPDAGWPERQLAFTARNSADKRRFVLAGCNVTAATSAPADVGFRYVVIHIP